MDITQEEKLLIQLRDCFTAGYTLPQYCIDNNIKRPLFVSEKNYELFLWEIYVQFKYDKRLMPQFCFIDADETLMHFGTAAGNVTSIYVKNISATKFDDFDKIIFLTTKEPKENDKKFISFFELQRFFIQHTYVNIPLLNFLQRYPKVKLILTNFPRVERYENRKTFDLRVDDEVTLKQALRERKQDDIKTPFDKFGYTNQEVCEIIKTPKLKVNSDGSTTMIDDEFPLIKIHNGKRATAYQPEHFLNKIYIVGTCHHYGFQAPFDKTIESYLQQLLNENNLPYRVENEGQCYWNRYQDIFYNLNKLSPMPGDIVFIYCENFVSPDNYLPFFDLSDAFDPPHDYKEIFCTKRHINELGYKILAERYFKYLTENNFFRDVEFNYHMLPPPSYHRYGIPPWTEQGGVNFSVNAELEAYKKQIKAKRVQIGALVMNCNPFTLGHQYLVEYAAARVDRLYIFVVEEDKSEFPFADRIELVRQGVKHVPNVEVLPSGKFIISQTTFSGYFNKAELQDVAVDSSEDVEIFGREIAPTLGITIRFAGEEPTDNVTRQYNETMKKILPRYDVEFCEIPRKEIDGELISASKVREALKRGDFDKIKNFVPATTYLYLREQYSVSKNFYKDLIRASILRKALENDDFDKMKNFVPETTFAYLRENQSEFKRYFTARLDIKLMSEEGDFQILSVSDKKAIVWKPAWLQAWLGKGVGYQIQSYAGNLEIVAKATVTGRLLLNLLAMDVVNPKTSTRIPYWIDYTKLTIDGNVIFDKITPAWHNKPYRYNMDARAGEEIKIEVEWLPHNT